MFPPEANRSLVDSRAPGTLCIAIPEAVRVLCHLWATRLKDKSCPSFVPLGICLNPEKVGKLISPNPLEAVESCIPLHALKFRPWHSPGSRSFLQDLRLQVSSLIGQAYSRFPFQASAAVGQGLPTPYYSP